MKHFTMCPIEKKSQLRYNLIQKDKIAIPYESRKDLSDAVIAGSVPSVFLEEYQEKRMKMKENHSQETSLPQNDTLLFMSLPEDYKAILVRHYGPQPEAGKHKISAHPIATIQSLTEREQCVIDGQYLVSSAFSIQILYKVKGDIQQNTFNQAAREISNKNPMLRSSFCKLGDRMVRVTFFSRMPEITYRNMEHMSGSSLHTALSKIMTEEKRRGFDLVTDTLVRINVIHTGESEYAVIVTQSVLTALSWSAHELIAKALNVTTLSPENLAGVYISEQETELSRVVLAYWKSLLKDIPHLPDVPGHKPSAKAYKPAEYEFRIAPRDFKILMDHSNGNKNMLMTLLQTAWGLFLQYVSGNLDTYYCLLLPDNCARLQNATATIGIINPMIVRLTCDESQKMKDIVGQQFRQMITSQSYACSRIQDLCRAIDHVDLNDLFTHFLSFHTFSMHVQSYAKAEGSADGRVVDMHSWEPRLYDLAVYFHLDEQGLRVIFVYNQNNFIFYGIERLAKYYDIVLHALLANWEHSFEDFELSLHDHLAGIRGNKLDANIKQQKRIDFFSHLEMFHELPKQQLKILAAAAQMKIYSENDIIPMVDQEDSLLFIADGTVARSIDHGTSISPLDIRKENSCLNENALLTENSIRLSLQIVTEKAHIISLPVSAIRGDKELWGKMLAYAQKEVEKYQQNAIK